MILSSSAKIVIGLVAIALAASGAYAGYFHDQSIKGVYADLNPQISVLQSDLRDRDARISSLTSQVSNLQGQISALKSQIASLQDKNGQLQQQLAPIQKQVFDLQASVNRLQTELDSLKAPSMDGVFTTFGTGSFCFFGCSASVKGAWVNYGSQNARNVVVTLTWTHAGKFVQSNEIKVGVVAARSIAVYPDTTFTLDSPADHVDWSFSFTA